MPSVTQVLKPFSGYENVPEAYLDPATERGRRIHAACASIALRVPILRRDPEDAGYIQSFRTWFDRYVVKVVGVELELKDPNLNFIGHLDFLFELIPGMIPELRAGDLAIIDLKTPIVRQKAWAAQAVSYLHLAKINKYPARAAGSLQLDPEGGPARLNWYVEKSARDFAAFLNALSAHNYFKEG
jgi:hypothetical protein